jgi:signal peptidase II
MSISVKFRRACVLAIVALGVFVFDQTSKAVVVEFIMQPPRKIELTDFFNLVLSFNPGISFGMLSGLLRDNAVALGTVQAIVALTIMIFALYSHRRIDALALSMLAGGAASNSADRLHRGAVVDFIDIHIAGMHWPAFNFADVAVVAGVMVFAASGMFGSRPSNKTQVNGS